METITGKKVLCLGSAVMDITASPISPHEEWKEKQRISDIRIRIGGDAANQCVHMASLGLHPYLITCTGDDERGEMLKSVLTGRGVDISLVRCRKELPTGTAVILLDKAGERRIFSVKGAHSLLSYPDLPDPEKLEDCKAVSLASIFSMPELEREGLEEFLKQLKKKGIPVFADLASDKAGAGREGIQRFLPYITFFIPSVYDVTAMTGSGDAPEAAMKLMDLGCDHVLIKCGADGCYVQDGQGGRWIRAVKVDPVDTTGAGDCFNAVFLTRFLAGDPVDDAAAYACAAASYSTLFAGASDVTLTEEDILAFAGRFGYNLKRG